MKEDNNSIGFNFLLEILKWKKFLLTFIILSTLTSAIISFILPKWYKSSTTLILPKSQGILGNLSGITSLLKEISPGTTSKLGIQSNQYNYLAILKSRKIAEAMINKFNLIDVYEITDRSLEKTIEEFHDNLNIMITEEGSIIIELIDKDPQRCSDMVNYMASLLNDINIELSKLEARNNRIFINSRIDETKNLLINAQEKLKSFQEKHGLIILTEDLKGTASAIGELYAKKMKLEIELSILNNSVGKENIVYKQVEIELKELERKLLTIPQLGMESFNLYKDVVIYSKILELLIPIYEQARIEENKNIPTILVLDKAYPAEKKYLPKRLLITMSTFLSSIIIGLLFILFQHRIQIFKNEKPTEFIKMLKYFKQ